MSNSDVKITAQLRHPCGLVIDITGTPEEIQNAAAKLNEMAAALEASGGKVAPSPAAPTLGWPWVIGGQYIAGCQWCATGTCYLHGKWPQVATNNYNCPVCGKLGCTEMHITCVNNIGETPDDKRTFTVGTCALGGQTGQAFVGMLGGGDSLAMGLNSTGIASTSVH